MPFRDFCHNCIRFTTLLFVACHISTIAAAERPSVSGIYPHLTMFNSEGECGTGAVVPFADRLWVMTYGPHLPKGSSDRLYEILPDLTQIVRSESIGGTPANRMLHAESKQLFMGPYAIREDRTVRAIPYANMFGRHTGLARHLTNPSGRIVFATMEEGVYEVDVHTLEVKELWTDEQVKMGRHANLPGYHGKGFYSGQGRYVYANNGEHGGEALKNPSVASGVLAEWNGTASEWTVVRRNQFTDVTGPGGIQGNAKESDPLWSIGWDHRSLILMLLDAGQWHAYRLPKTSHCYDGAHGWNTEWPRIRDIGEERLLMTMHGAFWKFPRTFSRANSAGLAQRSTYLKVVGDFCRWNDRVVLGCDDTAKSEFLNKHKLKGNLAGPGQSQSNLWFVKPEQLDQFGPQLGRGAVWLNEPVKQGIPSEPFLFGGFAHRSLQLSQGSDAAVDCLLEVDVRGDNTWTKLRSVAIPAKGSAWTEFPASEQAVWIRHTLDRDCPAVSGVFHYRGEDRRPAECAAMFQGLGGIDDKDVTGGTLWAASGERVLRFLAHQPVGELGGYDLWPSLELKPTSDANLAQQLKTTVGIPPRVMTVDAASWLYIDAAGRRWRLPKGHAGFDQPGPLGEARVCREVCTERNLLHVGGTFYEMPAENAGGFAKLRPIATHDRRIHDFASYHGLLVLSGVRSEAAASEHIVRSSDGKCALWLGAVDDLWQLGKPRGRGGPWHNTPVKAGEPSDAFLAAGYDRKSLSIFHESGDTIHVRVEADVSGNGQWIEVATLPVATGKTLVHEFPQAFGAYWLRLVSNRYAELTAEFTYE